MVYSIENFGYDIIDCDVLEERSDDVIRQLFNKSNSGQELLYLKYLNHLISNCSNLSSGISRQTKRSVKSSIEDELSGEDLSDEVRSELTSLLNKL